MSDFLSCARVWNQKIVEKMMSRRVVSLCLLAAILLLSSGGEPVQARNLDALWKFLETTFGFAAPDFSPMPMPAEGEKLLKEGYAHEYALFHHSFTKMEQTESGEPLQVHVVVPYTPDRLINWVVARDALEEGFEQLEQLRTGDLADGDPIAQLKDKVMGYWDFVPRELASVPVNKSTVSFASPCYRKYTAQFEEIDKSGGILTVTVNQSEPYRDDCVLLDKEFLTFASSLGYFKAHVVQPVVGSNGVGSFKMVMLSWARDEFEFLQQSGMHISVWPLGTVGTVLSLLNTTELFVGSDVKAMAQRNANFMGERVNFTMRKRENPTFLVPEEKEVRSGDVMQILRLDGLDPVIGWGTGGHTGHTTMVLELNGTMHVVESTAANPFGPVYWPPPYGVISTPYSHWFELAKEANYIAVLNRLNDQVSAKFNQNLKAAQDFFFSVKGQPYGFRNFIFSFFDTLWYNLPFPVTPYLFHSMMNLADRIADNRTSQMSIYWLMTQGMNHRLNTTCETMECINQELLRLDKLFAEVALWPEQDSYRYAGQHSMVCDVFILSVFKAAGIVPQTIQATEQTPKDLYQMDIYNKTTDWFPAVCKSSKDFDPSVPYCQLQGDYYLELNNYSTIALYDKMNEHCHSDPFESYWRGPDPTTC